MNITQKLSAISGENLVVNIIKTIECHEDATMYIVDYDNGACTSVIIYPNGELFYLSDWQGGYPECVEDIPDFDWIYEGKPVSVLNGLPRILG